MPQRLPQSSRKGRLPAFGRVAGVPDETVTKIETLTDTELNQEDDLMHPIASRLSRFLGRA